MSHENSIEYLKILTMFKNIFWVSVCSERSKKQEERACAGECTRVSKCQHPCVLCVFYVFVCVVKCFAQSVWCNICLSFNEAPVCGESAVIVLCLGSGLFRFAVCVCVRACWLVLCVWRRGLTRSGGSFVPARNDRSGGSIRFGPADRSFRPGTIVPADRSISIFK